jgi:hypothetical protein
LKQHILHFRRQKFIPLTPTCFFGDEGFLSSETKNGSDHHLILSRALRLVITQFAEPSAPLTFMSIEDLNANGQQKYKAYPSDLQTEREL